jgi:hypothetical protein
METKRSVIPADIDVIKIRSDHDEASTAARKTYNYRVRSEASYTLFQLSTDPRHIGRYGQGYRGVGHEG